MAKKPTPDAIATEKFKAVPDGEVYPRWFDKGDELFGQVAATMIEAGKAKKPKTPGRPPGSKSKTPANNKAKGAAPANKSK